MNPTIIFLICAIALVLLSFILWIFSRYKKCPSDKIMVIYGSIGKNGDGTTALPNVSTAARNLSFPFSSPIPTLI